METFTAFYSFPFFPLISSFSVLLFSKFHPRDPLYLFYPQASRSTLNRVVGLPSPSRPPPALVPCFSFCFPRYPVFLVSRTFAKHHSPQVIHLSYPRELLTSDSLPPPIKGAYREIFRGRFSYLSVTPSCLSLYFVGFAVSF